jgi:pimeloyl-ACP methyl ester carboxylesterase
MGTVVSMDGTSIAFDRYGQGPPIVLVGGAFQYRAFDPRTAELAKLLSTDFTVLHYDRRGRGDSGDTAPYSLHREVEDIDALVAEAGGSASVFGMSSGAALALEAAARGTAIKRLRNQWFRSGRLGGGRFPFIPNGRCYHEPDMLRA